jgi:hypothetical protein
MNRDDRRTGLSKEIGGQLFIVFVNSPVITILKYYLLSRWQQKLLNMPIPWSSYKRHFTGHWRAQEVASYLQGYVWAQSCTLKCNIRHHLDMRTDNLDQHVSASSSLIVTLKANKKGEAVQTICCASLICNTTPAFLDNTDRKWIYADCKKDTIKILKRAQRRTIR